MERKWFKTLSAGCLVAALSVPVFATQTAPTKTTTPAAATHPATHTATHAATHSTHRTSKSSGSAWVRSIQEALKAKGNDPGPIDGRLGHKTTAAIKAFQTASGLKDTGKIDKDTADKLGVEMPKTSHSTAHTAHSSKTPAKKESTTGKKK